MSVKITRVELDKSVPWEKLNVGEAFEFTDTNGCMYIKVSDTSCLAYYEDINEILPIIDNPSVVPVEISITVYN